MCYILVRYLNFFLCPWLSALRALFSQVHSVWSSVACQQWRSWQAVSQNKKQGLACKNSTLNYGVYRLARCKKIEDWRWNWLIFPTKYTDITILQVLKQLKKRHEIQRNWRWSFQQIWAGRVRSWLEYHAWIPVPAKTHWRSPKFLASNFWALLSLTIEERLSTSFTSDRLRRSDTFAPRGSSACCRSSYLRSVCVTTSPRDPPPCLTLLLYSCTVSLYFKHRKNCECSPGHYLIVNH